MSQIGQLWVLPAEGLQDAVSRVSGLEDLVTFLESTANCVLDLQAGGAAALVLLEQLDAKPKDDLAIALEQRVRAPVVVLHESDLRKVVRGIQGDALSAEALEKALTTKYGFFDEFLAAPLLEAAEQLRTSLPQDLSGKSAILIVYE